MALATNDCYATLYFSKQLYLDLKALQSLAKLRIFLHDSAGFVENIGVFIPKTVKNPRLRMMTPSRANALMRCPSAMGAAIPIAQDMRSTRQRSDATLPS